MPSSLHAKLLVGITAAAMTLGAVAAHAEGAADLPAAQQHAAALDTATGGDNLVSKAVADPKFADAARDFANSPEAKEAVDALKNILEEVMKE